MDVISLIQSVDNIEDKNIFLVIIFDNNVKFITSNIFCTKVYEVMFYGKRKDMINHV